MARTASATVYDILQRNIMNLTLIPGTPMSEKDISEKMSVSRTPVREAFIRLSKEALVSIIPQKGSFVSKISLSRVREERFLRESLEISVIEDLILNHDSLELKGLNENLKQQKIVLEKKQFPDFVELDDLFHASLFNMANKPKCYDVILSFSSHYRRVRLLALSANSEFMNNFNHHRKIIEALEKRDLELAKDTMMNHLRKLNIEKNDIFNQYPDYFEDEKNVSLLDEKALFSNMKK